MRRLAILLLLLWPRDARASDLDDARVLDASFAFADALRAYEHASAARTPAGAEAAARAEVLRAHSEGGFMPFTLLEHARRTPGLDVALDLGRRADGFPVGLVRVESWILSATTLEGAGRRAEAVPFFRKVIGDPFADRVWVAMARRELVSALEAQADFKGARAAATDPSLLREVNRRERRLWLHHASTGLLVAVPMMALFAILRSHRRAVVSIRRVAPLMGLFVLWVGLLGGALSASYEPATSLPFWALGAALLLFVPIARGWAAAGSPARLARLLRATLSAATVLAAAFRVLEGIDVDYLDGLGL